MRQEVSKILICTTKRETNGIIGSGFSSWNTGELVVVTEVKNLNEAEDFKNIDEYFMIPIYRFSAKN